MFWQNFIHHPLKALQNVAHLYRARYFAGIRRARSMQNKAKLLQRSGSPLTILPIEKNLPIFKHIFLKELHYFHQRLSTCLVKNSSKKNFVAIETQNNEKYFEKWPLDNVLVFVFCRNSFSLWRQLFIYLFACWAIFLHLQRCDK